uniref:Chloroplast heterodimeric geranylgeranyl pyrophosphate synthase small subunit n=1 Tax=Paeonia lactiflora TaxID=35924 RepID=A0A0G3BEA5_PAELC|nr:chloroplast heterodimeric geranylgeranyl pyrophosphate synthase small subunit [Paeonia lactiflora]
MAGALLHINGTKPSLLTLSRSKPHRPLFSYKPMRVSMSHNSSYWATIDSDIEAHLKQAIPVRPPLVVFEPMHHLTFAAPKNTAPALCIATCELVGGHRDQAIAAASALHLIHAAAFTHEHLPLTDRPTPISSRPGLIHHAFNPNIELLTGDGIHPFGYELLARSDDPSGDNSDRVLRVIIEITRATGSQGYIDGQYRETLGDVAVNVCEKKEGSLYGCAAACGAILGGGSEEEIEKLRKYGFYVGMIQGMLYGVGRNTKGSMDVVIGLRDLALKELKYFDQAKVEKISGLVEANLTYA